MDLNKKIKFDESTVSMVLGALVVIVVGLLVYNYFVANKKAEQGSSPQKVETTGPTSTVGAESGGSVAGFSGSLPTTHVVAQGEDLWKISLTYYGSGYNWVDIAKENKIGNPNLIAAGVKLSIPKVEPKAVAVVTPPGSITITGSSYTVAKGDTLWEVAVRAYGDGFRWVDIAKANKLANPGLIHPGNVLSIPR